MPPLLESVADRQEQIESRLCPHISYAVPEKLDVLWMLANGLYSLARLTTIDERFAAEHSGACGFLGGSKADCASEPARDPRDRIEQIPACGQP